MLKMVEDRLAKKVYTVNDEKAMLLSYNNRNRRIVRSAEIYEKGEPTGEYATYVEEGTIDTVRERLSAWDNALKMIYAQSVEFNAAENDPDNSKYEAFVRSIEEHEDKYFDEYGDLITSWTLNLETLKAAGLYTDEVLLPMGYIPLSEYCKKHGYDMRNVRRKLASGEMTGIKKAGNWFLDENAEYKKGRGKK